MYTIFADGQIIHSPALDRPTALVFGAKLTQQANMADSFVFTIYPNNPAAATIHKLTTIIEVYQDDSLLFRGRPIQSKEGWNKETTYTCEGGFAYFNDTILRPYEFAGTVREYLQSLVTQHNSQVPAEKQFTLRTVTVTDPNDYIVRSNSDYTTTMSEIQEKLVGNLGGYLVPEYTGGQWYLDYLATSSEATGQTITLAKNLLDFIREQNAENIATALIPLGAVDENTGERITIKSVNDGLDYIVDAAAAAQYGLIFTTETWDDVTVPANLLTKAQERLTDYATLIPTIQLTAVDLSITDQEIDPIRLLDNVTVQDDQHTASGRYIVMARTYDLSDPAADQITFGGAMPTISGIATKTASEIQEIPARVLKNASERARAILENATGGAVYFHYNDDGILDEIDILNTDNPATATKIWRWNIGGWGYSDDGGQTYKTAATMDGAIVATLITTGILKSDDGTTFYLDLDNGILKGNFSELKISGNAGATQAYADQAEADAISTAASNTSTAIGNYDTNLNQLAVFNKLTNNGVTQGIYLQNNKIYINGEYIKANTIGADSIIGESITIAKLAPAAKDVLITGTTVKNQYYLSTSSSSATGGSWSDTTPTWSPGKYVWTRVSTTKTYADGDITTTTSTAVYDKTLTDALSAASSAQTTANGNVTSTVSCYYRSTSSTTPTISTSTSIGTSATTDNAWEYVMPRPKKNTYMFTCERYTKADGSVSFSTVRQMSMLTYASMWCSASDATCIDGGAIYTESVTADKISVNDLYALGATIGGWKISASAIYKDVSDPNDSNTVYRVYLQPPLASNPTGTWVLSCQKSTNGGQSFGGTFVLYSDGSAKFGDLNISSNGSISTPNVSGAWITLGTKANNFVHNISGVNDHYYDYRSNFMTHSKIDAGSIQFGKTDNNGNTTVKTILDKDQLQLSAEGSSFIGNLTIKPPANVSSSIMIQPVVVSTW